MRVVDGAGRFPLRQSSKIGNSTSQNENSLLEKSWYNIGTALKEDLIMAKH